MTRDFIFSYESGFFFPNALVGKGLDLARFWDNVEETLRRF